jgi:catechol 2,3-dioxygenase-like lactoylglutathione lyase family enzyme
MLSENSVAPTIAVKDLSKARKFYEGSLGLKQISMMGDDAILYKSGNTKIMVYRSAYAGTNEATAMSWEVGDVEAEVRALKGKGITFEHYNNLPGMTLQGDIHVGGGMKEAWFKDPDGNILNLSTVN